MPVSAACDKLARLDFKATFSSANLQQDKHATLDRCFMLWQSLLGSKSHDAHRSLRQHGMQINICCALRDTVGFIFTDMQAGRSMQQNSHTQLSFTALCIAIYKSIYQQTGVLTMYIKQRHFLQQCQHAHETISLILFDFASTPVAHHSKQSAASMLT